MNKLISVIKTYPIISFGVIILLVDLVVGMLQLEYDAGWIILFVLLDILGLPYWIVRETLFSLNDGRGFGGIDILTIFFGLIIFVLLELVYQLLRKKFRKSNNINY